MSGALPEDERRRLAAFLLERRHELVREIAASAAASELADATVATFAKRLLGRLCFEARDGDTAAVDRLAKLSAGRDKALAFGRIAVEGCRVVSEAFVAGCERPDDVVAYLALRSSELERRFRSERCTDRETPSSVAFVRGDEAVSSLLSALAARDVGSGEHSRAVGFWSGRIAKTIGLSERQQGVAVLAGTLHEVGKIATPTELLLKPGPLTSEEWEVMRSHSPIGAKMLERIPSLRQLAPIVRAHHERVDGEGYPDGLRGSAIPLLARVVAVCDSFHAMVSSRPYRQPRAVASALGELRRGAGTQWDVRVVDAMVSIVQPPASGAPPERLAGAAP